MEKNKKMYFNEKEMNLQIQNYNLNNDYLKFLQNEDIDDKRVY